uniref:TMEM181 GOLD domain-containing protein n=1 Tax=Sphenodon punctatus TaxID=8508 RepID=A0A8D0G5Z5_SPHPU
MELLAPMRLYTLSKRHFVLVFVVFFICFGLTVFIGIAGPNAIESTVQPSKSDGSKVRWTFNSSSPSLSTYNQQLWLTCIIQLRAVEGAEMKIDVPMTVQIWGVVEDASVSYVNNQIYKPIRKSICKEKCAEIIVAHLGYLNYTQYHVMVVFHNKNSSIKNVDFKN